MHMHKKLKLKLFVRQQKLPSFWRIYGTTGLVFGSFPPPQQATERSHVDSAGTSLSRIPDQGVRTEDLERDPSYSQIEHPCFGGCTRHVFYYYFTARCYAKRGTNRYRVFVYLSVRPSHS